MTPILRLTIVAIGLAAGAACVLNPSSNGPTASSGRVVVSEIPHSGVSTRSVWVVSAVGLNIHSDPDLQATKLTTVTQGVRLDISEKRVVGADTWLHVKTEGGNAEGWVVDRPELVIHRMVSQHVESSGGWSILFPSEWSPVSGNPATFTGSADAAGGSMLVQTAADPAQLMPIPISAGHELRQESPIDVYGRTTYITIFKMDAGGFEFDVKVQFPKTKVAYLVDFKQPVGSDADTTLFKQLLDSLIPPGE